MRLFQRSTHPALRGHNSFADAIIYLILVLLTIASVVPIVHVLSVSFSNGNEAAQMGLMLWPKGFTIDSYLFVFKGPALLHAYGVTIFITVVGTTLNLLLTITAAYVLSRSDLPGRGVLTLFVVITMIFSAGIIPGYMLIRNLGLLDSVWAMILPGAVSAFNLILMRNFFEELPVAIIESARIDGASEFRILTQIVIPLSGPAIATIGLFYAVAHWNEFFRGIFYITDSTKWPLQVLLRSVVVMADLNELGMSNRDLYGQLTVNQLTIRAATVMAAVVPIAALYPFLQRYFVKGIVLGAEKG
jgi:putative aldouronate transport system permease protein